MDKKIQHAMLVIITWVYGYNLPSVLATTNCLALTTTSSADTTTCLDLESDNILFTGTITSGAGTATSETGTTVSGTGTTASGTTTSETETTASGTATSETGTTVSETGTATSETKRGIKTKIEKKQGVLKTNYLNLSFKQGGKSKRFYKGEKQRAIAKLSSTGSGNIQIRWEIARPPFSNQSNPLFTLIRQEQKTLVGHQQKEFSSPILPNKQVGLYLLRVRVINSAKDKDKEQSALLRYYIAPAKQNITIQLLNPAAAETMDKNTDFKWRISTAISQTNIQIFTQKSPQTGCNIAASQHAIVEIATKNSHQSMITPIAAHQLKQGQGYCWRIQAYNKGRMVKQSKARHFIWQTSPSLVSKAITADQTQQSLASSNSHGNSNSNKSISINKTPNKTINQTTSLNKHNDSIATLLFSNTQQINGQVIALVKDQQERQQLVAHPDVQLIDNARLQAYPFELMLIQSRSNRSVSVLMAELKQQLPHIPVQANFIYQQNAGSVPQYSLSVMKVKQNNRQAGRGVRIGIIDTLIDTQHADLRSANIKQINLLSDQKNNGKVHGTAIASLIVGQSGIRGVAPAAKLVNIAAFYARPGAKTAGRSSSFLLAKAFDKAVLQNVKVLNLSFGSARKDPLLNRLVKGARQKGMILVASVGNSAQAVYYPAALSSVIAVTATDANNKLYSRANRGRQVELAAPGVGIMAARAHGKYTYMSGTSFATAHITGMIAHLISQGKSSSRSNLHQAAKDLGAAGKDNRFGYGLLTLY